MHARQATHVVMRGHAKSSPQEDTIDGDRVDDAVGAFEDVAVDAEAHTPVDEGTAVGATKGAGKWVPGEDYRARPAHINTQAYHT